MAIRRRRLRDMPPDESVDVSIIHYPDIYGDPEPPPATEDEAEGHGGNCECDEGHGTPCTGALLPENTIVTNYHVLTGNHDIASPETDEASDLGWTANYDQTIQWAFKVSDEGRNILAEHYANDEIRHRIMAETEQGIAQAQEQVRMLAQRRYGIDKQINRLSIKINYLERLRVRLGLPYYEHKS
jgi:hypothetical protein